jgi:MFS family permease
MDLSFFGVPFLVQDNWFLQVLVYTVPFLLLSFASIFTGTVYKRWGQFGMYVMSIGGLVLGGAAAVVLTWQQAWGTVGRFFADTSALALLAGYPLALSVLLAAAGYLILRRATP